MEISMASRLRNISLYRFLLSGVLSWLSRPGDREEISSWDHPTQRSTGGNVHRKWLILCVCRNVCCVSTSILHVFIYGDDIHWEMLYLVQSPAGINYNDAKYRAGLSPRGSVNPTHAFYTWLSVPFVSLSAVIESWNSNQLRPEVAVKKKGKEKSNSNPKLGAIGKNKRKPHSSLSFWHSRKQDVVDWPKSRVSSLFLTGRTFLQMLLKWEVGLRLV